MADLQKNACGFEKCGFGGFELDGFGRFEQLSKMRKEVKQQSRDSTVRFFFAKLRIWEVRIWTKRSADLADLKTSVALPLCPKPVDADLKNGARKQVKSRDADLKNRASKQVKSRDADLPENRD